jgi:hypothetical protein
MQINNLENAHITKRKEKAEWIIGTCKRAWITDVEIPYEWLVSEMCLKFGAGRRYIKEVVRDLEITRRIKVIDKLIFYVPTQEEISEKEKNILNNLVVDNETSV